MISFERLKEILECFSKVKIAVVGDMMLDEYLIGKVTRISPEAPVPVVNIEQERFVLGGASNVANNLKSLSAQVSVYGVVGQDSNGEKFVKLKNITEKLLWILSLIILKITREQLQ